MFDPEESQEKEEEVRTEAQELLFIENLVGMTITEARYSQEDGVMLEFDGRIRFKSCCPHSSFYTRRIN
jgi:hypothetical protein